jgi:aminopeptidase N
MNPVKTIYRKDYTPPVYTIQSIDLHVTLGEDKTIVNAKIRFIRGPHTASDMPLILNGRELELVSLKLNESNVHYIIDEEHLTIPAVPDDFMLETVCHIYPHKNTSLEGLYKVNNLFCTQCEAQGFRKITYYLDRPDVMATFTTTIVADKNNFPVLLSNGNLIKHGDLSNGQHFATWQDPFKKPCYLFALVAGDLACIDDSYKTMSGRQVALKLYVDHGDEDKTAFAVQSVKRAMRWDEENYGREYDLDIFMIVSTHDFNMGAMENKGLNIFNSKYILAKPETATDEDFIAIERVIGHEYFHNWTGNRITCRDWFQLSLKESLTVFRDSTFSADMNSPAVVRISDVNTLRNVQFPQDAGPMAHPVRPESYMEINNFYTVTIYEKGAEVIRMLWTLLGKQRFRHGMDCYFERFDGQAVTIDDFVQAHADANHVDLSQFMRWYDQAGTPECHVTSRYDEELQQFTLSIKQNCPSTPGQVDKKPYYLPFAIGLLGDNGQELHQQVLAIKNSEESFTFNNIAKKPIASLLRDFSAPVKLFYDYQDDELAFLLAHDKDPFSRWDAGQQLAIRFIQRLLNQQNNEWHCDELLVSAWKSVLSSETIDPAFAALLLVLPAEQYLIELFGPIDLDKLFAARQWLHQQLAISLKPLFLSRYLTLSNDSIGHRALKNRCLSYLGIVDDQETQQLILSQLKAAKNMTDEIAALSAISHSTSKQRENAIQEFYQKWQGETLVIDKWLSIQARSELPGTLDRVKLLLKHSAFSIKNPNKVRSLIGAFCQNLPQFHAIDGTGYQFLIDQITALNSINPMIAARLTEPLTRYRKVDTKRQQLMKSQLEKLRQLPNLAKDIYEIVEKSLVGQ